MPRPAPTELPLRIIVERPPPGVAFAVQLGKDELLAPTARTPDSIRFDLAVSVDQQPGDGGPRLRGRAVQGPPAGRFVYVTSGARAGQPGTPWERRAKIPLGGITPTLIAKQRALPGSVLEARIEGRARDGGPCCASVPLLGAGWTVIPGNSR